jgi:hypothetical protein
MTGFVDQIITLARQSLEDPRGATRSLLGMDIPLPARTIGLLLMAVASALFVHLGFLILPPPPVPLAQMMAESPLRTAVVQWVVLATSVLLIWRIGRAWGGRGSLPDALLVMVWLQLIMLAVQAVQLLALVIAPPIAGLLNLVGLALFFWLLCSFVAELHGFTSRAKVFAGVVVTLFGLALVIVIGLTALFGPEVLGSV